MLKLVGIQTLSLGRVIHDWDQMRNNLEKVVFRHSSFPKGQGRGGHQ